MLPPIPKPIWPLFVWSFAWVLATFLPLSVRAQGLGSDDDEIDGSISAERLIEMIQEILDRPPNPDVLAGVDLRRPSPDVRKMVRVLTGTVISVELVDQEVGTTLDLLRDITGLNFVISRRARKSLEEEDARLNIHLRNLSVRRILNLLAMHLGDYRFTLRYGAVIMVHKEEYRPKVTFRTYDIQDIVRPRRSFRAPRLGLGGLEDDEEF